MRDIALVILVVASAGIALRKPVYGILLFVAFGIVNPQGFTWGFGRSFPIAMIMAGATVAGWLMSPEPKRLPQQRETWILFSVWMMFGVSTAVAYFPHRGWMSDAALTQFIYVSKILVMIYISMTLLYTKERIQWLMKVVAMSIGLFALKGGLFGILTGGSQLVWGPPGSFLYANNAIGLAMAMNVPLLYYLIQEESNFWLRRVMWAMLIMSVPSIICTFSRGAWLGMMAAFGLILLKSRYRVLIVLGGMFMAIGVVIFLPFLSMNVLPDRVQQRLDQLINYEEEGSAVSRFWNWELCKRVGLANPLTGEGFDFYNPDMYAKYYPEFLDKYGYGKVWSCHNMWLTVLAEHGVLTFFLWLGLLFFSLLSLRAVQRFSRRAAEQEWMGNYAAMLEVSFIVYMIVGTFLDVAYFDLYYQLIVAVILLKECMYRVVRSWHAQPASRARWMPSHA